ncbi:MAG: hypothetical protein HOD72_01515 [Opitutae bacterium]|jgi:hypothetical protein|nr:hypothetical protein [Opitutae bacterium]MBT5379364.1 hypothetical protein [Opitutae bacterium]MBT5690500.1 hypothetical protein [Opitutae bacterium]MBT6464046.1 hypothetical protein [Opitutae bacterium]MBT7854032.1 hypothetical protein [Opitutae bacterium]
MKSSKILTLAGLALLLTASSSNAADKVPLKIEVPRPVFIGTPKPIKGFPHLERKGLKRGEILVPAGTTNIAAGKEVTGSDDFPIIGDLEFVTDGDKDGEEGYFVELAPKTQWVQIDLKKASEVHGVCIWHFHSQARAYHDVIVQISDDPDFVDGVKTVYNSDHDNSSKLGVGKDLAYIETYKGKYIDAKGAKGRYVRLYSAGNSTNAMNHYIEVEVFGK